MSRHIDFTKQPAEVRLMAHAIGLDHKRPYQRHGKFFYRPYRNYYSTWVGSPEYVLWERMAVSGYAIREKYPTRNDGMIYHLTRAGMDRLGTMLGITIREERE